MRVRPLTKSKVLNQFEDPLVLFNDDAKAKTMIPEVDAEARQHTKQDVVLFNDDAKAKAMTTEVDAEARQHTKQDVVLFNDDARAKAMTTEVDAEARQHTKQDVVLFNDDAKAKAMTTEVDAEARQHTKQDVVLFNDDAKAKAMTTEVDAGARQHTKEDDRSRRQISSPERAEARTQEIAPEMQLLKRMNLPEMKLRTFTGSIGSFRPFIRAFRTNIASKLDDEEEKLMYLVQFTEGRPKEIVSTCLHLPPQQGYQEALELLERRYSNDAQAGDGLVERMLSQVDIKPDDVASLESFSIHLRETLNALKSLPHGTGVVDSKAIQKIIGKIPFWQTDGAAPWTP